MASEFDRIVKQLHIKNPDRVELLVRQFIQACKNVLKERKK